MEQNQKDILIAKDEKSGEIGVVTGLQNDGTPKITDAKPKNVQDFLKFDKHGDVLDNFLSNFFRQYKEPNRFGFYRVAADGAENAVEVLKDLLKNPDANKELLAQHHVDTEKHEQQVKKEYQPIDEGKINWTELEEKWGVNRQSLEESGDLKKMLNYGKSTLVTVTPKFGDERFETEARLSFKVLPNGDVQLVPHLIRKEPQLDKAFEGHSFSAEDKDHLKKTGNMGRIAHITDRNTGKTVPAYISIDRLTNNVVAIPVNKVRIPEKIGNTPLTEQDIKTLRAGMPISNKEITLANGKKFTATLQVNVEQRGVEFVPHNSPLKHENSQGKKADKQEGQQQTKDNHFQWLDANGNIRAPKTFGGVTLTPEQQTDYTAGKTILVKDMVHDKQGQPYTAYIKFNQEEGKPKYYRSNPDVSQAQQVVPASENQTQVAVNSEGKTNEATKHIGKPMRQEQTAPINKQQEQRQNKPKGIGV
jgi:hypothetical protein